MGQRCTLEDSVRDVVFKLCEGNPGALDVMFRILKDHDAIDLHAPHGGIITLLVFDDLDIVGSSIWVLYKDVCGSSIRNLLMIMRAHQLGKMSTHELRACIKAERIEPARFGELNAQVEEELPLFQKREVEA
jgi:hypothetical protein